LSHSFRRPEARLTDIEACGPALGEFSESVLSKAKEVLRAEWDDRVGLVADRPPQPEGHEIFLLGKEILNQKH